MQSKSILLAIRACASRDGENDEPIELLTTGEMRISDGEITLLYEEAVDEELPPQAVEVTILDHIVRMDRMGEYTTSMVFAKGQRSVGQYQTPFGDMELAVFCTHWQVNMTDTGGTINVTYQLDMNGQFMSMNRVSIQVMLQNG